MKIKLTQIENYQGHRNQPEPDHIKNLATDIDSRGYDVECAVILNKVGRGKFEVIDGHHRIEAVRSLGGKEIDADVREVGPLEADQIRYSLNHLRREHGAIHYLASYASRKENMKRDGLLDEHMSNLDVQRAVAESLAEQGSSDAWFQDDGTKVSRNTRFASKALDLGLSAEKHFLGRDVHGQDGGLAVVNRLGLIVGDLDDAVERGDLDFDDRKDFARRIKHYVKKNLNQDTPLSIDDVFSEADEIMDEVPAPEGRNDKPIDDFVSRFVKWSEGSVNSYRDKAKELIENILPFAQEQDTEAQMKLVAIELSRASKRLNELAKICRQPEPATGLRMIEGGKS